MAVESQTTRFNHVVFSHFQQLQCSESDVPYSTLASLAPVILSHPHLPCYTPRRITARTIHDPLCKLPFHPRPRTVNKEPALSSLNTSDYIPRHEQPWTPSRRRWAAAPDTRSDRTTSEGSACQESRTCPRSHQG